MRSPRSQLIQAITLADTTSWSRSFRCLSQAAPGTVDIYDMIETIEESMSGRISGILKRPDEASLIRTVHQDPMFTEDVVRRMAWIVAGDKFQHLPENSPRRILRSSAMQPRSCKPRINSPRTRVFNEAKRKMTRSG